MVIKRPTQPSPRRLEQLSFPLRLAELISEQGRGGSGLQAFAVYLGGDLRGSRPATLRLVATFIMTERACSYYDSGDMPLKSKSVLYQRVEHASLGLI